MAARWVNWAGLLTLRLLWGRNGGRDAAFEGSLAGLSEGEEGLIVDVVGNSPLCCRLRELGVSPGVRVRVLRAGNPVVVQVEDGRFCLRRQDAALVRVRAGAGA